jgi:hypothetical protein
MGIKVAGIASVDTNKPTEKGFLSEEQKKMKQDKVMNKN